MTTTPTTTTVLSHIRHWLNRARAETSSDAALLRRFTEEGDETAFALLMDRHGPMVLGTARRLVGDEHLAEDVFQATFLTLARQAGRLRGAAALPAWLHAVACRLALTVLRERKRRHRAENNAVPRAVHTPPEDAVSQEQLAILDEELRRLPERFRLPLILCCLEGRSQAEAAALLGWTPGSLKGRLERGRNRLRDRLCRRGLTVAVAAAIPALSQPAFTAPLRDAVLRTARQGGSLSPLVSALVKEACKPLLVIHWKTILIVVFLGMVGTGVGMASRFAGSALDSPLSAEGKPAAPRVELDPEALPQGAVARLGSARLRIGNAAFALTPDGRSIVTVTPQGLVRRFDAVTGQLLERRQLTKRGDVDPVGQARAHLSADGRIVAIDEPYEGQRRLTVWEVSSDKQVFQRNSTAKRRTGFGALSPDGKLLALIEYEEGGNDKNVLRVVQLDSGQIRNVGRLEYNVYHVYFSADGKRLVASQIAATKGGGHTLVCFDVVAGKQLWCIPREGDRFAFSPDGKTVLTAMRDQRQFQILELDPASGKPTERFVPCNEVHPNCTLLIAPDNRTVIRNHFGQVILWDRQPCKEISRFTLPKTIGAGFGPEMGAISPDSRTLITNIGYLQRWDLTTAKPFFAAPPDDGLGSPIQHLAFTAQGKDVFASSSYHNSCRWDLATKSQFGLTLFKEVHQLIQTKDGLREVFIDFFKKSTEAALSDPLTGKVLSTVRWIDPKEITINALRAYTLTTDGKTLLVAHGKEPGNKQQTTTITACDVDSGRRLTRFSVPGEFYFERSPFSPCGRWVVMGDNVYNIGSGKALFAPAGEPGEQLVAWDRWQRMSGMVWFSEDSRLMAGLLRKKGEKSTANDSLAVWELATGSVLARYPKAGFIAQVAFSPDGRTLALLDGRGIRLEDLRTGKLQAEYAAPDVTCELTNRGCTTQTLAFSPGGSTLATGHLDGTILLWKVPRSHEVKPAAPSDGEAEKLWVDLGSSSPATARPAVDRLARHPDVATTLLATRFRPPPADAKLAALINDLDSENFAAREEAARKLRTYGARAEVALRRTLAKAPSLEMRRRIESILAEMAPPALRLPLSGERLRGVRAIEVLERIGDAAALRLLHLWAEQTEDIHLAFEARLALERTAMEMKKSP
ncbi:MAG TPA: sigma-70 family RNA polymerase sigma factor [Gemmataceae bacterium]|nr:sigma-70 family RNA polymerase sigma factor [Gemmataceae bacterium]